MRGLNQSLLLLLLAALAGCESLSRYGPASQPIAPPPTIAIPAQVTGPQATVPGEIVPDGAPPSMAIIPVGANRDATWDQIVYVVDDYFKISQEDRVKVVGSILTEGRIDTFPVTGATIFEPWRKDTVNMHERWESTLQSIQRRASIRVIPDERGYLVDVSVWKELEDVPKPIKASAGAATFRFDTSLQRDTEFDPDPNRIPGDPARPVGPRSPTAGWIYLGRDVALEQEILAQMCQHLGGHLVGPGQATMTPAFVSPATLPPQTIAPGPIVSPRTVTPPVTTTLPPPP